MESATIDRQVAPSEAEERCNYHQIDAIRLSALSLCSLCSARLISRLIRKEAADGNTHEVAQQQPQVRHYNAKQIKDRDEYEDDDIEVNVSRDPYLNTLLGSSKFKSVFASCSDRSVLFDSGDNETLDKEEKAEAENGINKYMARQEYRKVIYDGEIAEFQHMI